MNTTYRTNRSNQRLGGGTVTRDSILVQGQKQRRRQRHSTLKASSTSSCSSCPEDPVLVYPKGQPQAGGQTRDDGIVMSSLVSESPGCHSFLSPRVPEQPPSLSGVGTKKQSLYRRYNCLAPRTRCAGPLLNGPLTGMEDEEYSTASSLGKINNNKGIAIDKDDKTKIINNTSPNSNTYCTPGMSSFLFPTNDENETQNSHKTLSKRRYTLQKSLSNRSSSKSLLSLSSPQTPVTNNTNKTRSFPDTFFHTPQDEFGFPTTTTTTNPDQESPPSTTTSTSTTTTSTTMSDDEPTLRIFPAVSPWVTSSPTSSSTKLSNTLPKNKTTTTTSPLQNSPKKQQDHKKTKSPSSSTSRHSCWSSSGNTTVCSNDSSSHSDDAFTELVTAARSPHRGAYSSYMMMDQWFYPDQDDDSAVSEFFGSNYF